MTDYVDRATFMDQVKVGDLIVPDEGYGPDRMPWTVTGARKDQRSLSWSPVVTLVGVTDAGEPRSWVALPSRRVIVREQVGWLDPRVEGGRL